MSMIQEKDVPDYLKRDALDQRFRSFISRDEVNKALDTLTGEYKELKRISDEHQRLVDQFSQTLAGHGESINKLSQQHIEEMRQMIAQHGQTIQQATQNAVSEVQALINSAKTPQQP
jgi:ElaB/YqjD/DUF883 family membrane-anchored ribosome-binding protein